MVKNYCGGLLVLLLLSFCGCGVSLKNLYPNYVGKINPRGGAGQQRKSMADSQGCRKAGLSKKKEGNEMIKKTITIFLSILMLLTICGCSSNSTDATSSQTGSSEMSEIGYSVAMQIAKQEVQNSTYRLSAKVEHPAIHSIGNVRLASGDADYREDEDGNYWWVTIKGTFTVYNEYGRYSSSEDFTAHISVDAATGDVTNESYYVN